MSMIDIEKPLPVRFYMDSRLKKELDILLHFTQNQNDDIVIVIDGEEGSGKSKLARQIAVYCAQKLGVSFSTKDNIHFDLNQYVDTSLEKGQYWVNILDESRNVLNKKRSMASAPVRFTNYLSECRSKQQVHILLVPSYHDLDNYVVNWRMKFLINVLKSIRKADNECGWTLVRGEYVIHGKREAKLVYNTPEMRYRHPHFNKTDMCQFNNIAVIDEDEYEEKKQMFTIQKYHSEEVEKHNMSHVQKRLRSAVSKLCSMLKTNGFTTREIAKTINYSERQVNFLIKEEEDATQEA